MSRSPTFFRVLRLRRTNPSTTAFIERRRGESGGSHTMPASGQLWLPFEQISPNLVRAVIAGEDPKFLSHVGFDWGATLRAFRINLRSKRIVRGASTIDQQLAKNLFLSSSRRYLRKLREVLIAWEMNLFLGKRRILELYLNVIEWGDGIYGVEEAARHYFDTSAALLTDEQAAFLAAVIPRPRVAYDPALPPEWVRHRRDIILAFMREDSISEAALRRLAINKVMPTFPERAKEQGADGVAVAQLEIDRQGNIVQLEILIAPHDSIREAVAHAVNQWKFRPPHTSVQTAPFTGKLTFYYTIHNGEPRVRNPR